MSVLPTATLLSTPGVRAPLREEGFGEGGAAPSPTFAAGEPTQWRRRESNSESGGSGKVALRHGKCTKWLFCGYCVTPREPTGSDSIRPGQPNLWPPGGPRVSLKASFCPARPLDLADVQALELHACGARPRPARFTRA